MNKTVLGLTGLATIALATVPFGIVNADLSQTSTAQIEFTEDTDPTSPLNPLDPTSPLTPKDNNNNEVPKPGTAGPLSIDFASSFNFGSQKVTPFKKVYEASAQITNTDKTVPNYVQVTDKRGDGKNAWRLSVSRDAFKNKGNDKDTLDNVTLEVANGSLHSGSLYSDSGVDTISGQDSFKITTAAYNVMSSVSDKKAAGTWLYSMGNDTNKASSVTLTVPAGTAQTAAATYVSTLTWNLIDGPAQ